jgi:hypothetical protein
LTVAQPVEPGILQGAIR